MPSWGSSCANWLVFVASGFLFLVYLVDTCSSVLHVVWANVSKLHSVVVM